MASGEKRFDDQGLERLDDEACWSFVARHHLGRVAMILHDRPIVFPVNYVLDGGSTIVFRSAPGSKLSAAGRGVVVAFEVDEADELFERGTSVIVHGHAAEVVDRDEQARLARLPIRAWAPGDRDHFVKIVSDRVTGRSIPMVSRDDGLGADGG